MANLTSPSFPFARAAAAATGLLAVAGMALLFATGSSDPAELAGSNPAGPAATSAPAALAAGGASERAPATARLGCWDAPVGSELRFRLVDHVDVTLRSAEGGTQPGGTLHVEAEVVTTVLARRADEALVRHQLGGLRFLGTDGRDLAADPIQTRLLAAAATPVHARIARDGELRGYGFADGLDGDQRNFLRGTLGLFACPAPAAGATAWTGTGEDTTGTFTARHELLATDRDDAISVTRTRTRYTRMAGHAEVPEHTLRGATTVHFAPPIGWLSAVELDEGMTLALGMLDLQAITARTASLQLVAATTLAVRDDVAPLWASTNAAVSSIGEVLGGHAAANERSRWQAKLANVTTDQLLAELQQLLARQPVDAAAVDAVFQQLQWLVQLDDQVAADLELQVATARIGGDVMRTAVSAFGAAGTDRAQQALATLCFDPGQPAAVREAASLSSLQLQKPSPTLVEGMFASASTDSPQRTGSLLVAGALAGRAQQPLADGRTPLQALLAMEADAQARGELDSWLLAVANTGAPAALPIALRLLGHPQAAVRGAACVALRGQADASALQALIERGLHDSDAMVRQEAVLALSRRSEPAAREALQVTASQDPDEAVRGRATRALQG